MAIKMQHTPSTDTIIPYGRQSVSAEDIKEVVKVLKSDFLTQGPVVQKFEIALSKYCGAKYAVVFSSGTAALHAACHAAGLNDRDEAITTPISFVATANAVRYCGASVQFCDVDPENAQITFDQIQKQVTKKTKAILPVDLCGLPADLVQLYPWCQKKKIVVIRDAAHSLGASYTYQQKKIKVGACAHEDMCCLSFHPVKSITTGEGGAVLTNNKTYYERLVRFRQHGITKNQKFFVHKKERQKIWYHEMQDLGYNYRLSDIHSALGLSQLKTLDEKIKKRKKIVEYYHKKLRNVVSFLSCGDDEVQSAHHILPILVPHRQRDGLMQALAKKKIFTQLHYIPIYRQPWYQKQNQINGKNFPHAENYFRSAVSIPVYPALKKAEQHRVIDEIKNYLCKY